MRSVFRTPDELLIRVTRHEFRAETSLEITHHEGGLLVVIFDDWYPGHLVDLGEGLAQVVDVWQRTGPIAAAALTAQWSRRSRRRR